MALYRDNGVNPAPGCIPILLTGSWRSTAVDHGGQNCAAPFVGWIHDLSLPRPALRDAGARRRCDADSAAVDDAQAGVDPAAAHDDAHAGRPDLRLRVDAGGRTDWLVGNVWRIGQMQVTNHIHPPKVHCCARLPSVA